MLISDHNDAFFLYKFRPVQDYFSSYETGKSVTGGGGEGRILRKRTCTPTSKTWFVSPVIVRLINWTARLRRRVHRLGVGSFRFRHNMYVESLC